MVTVTESTKTEPTVGVIACGAIARELVALAKLNNWDQLKLHCLPAELHNHPDDIPGSVADKLVELRDRYEHLFVAYADCGTGGRLDSVLQEHGVARLPGAHCYEFFASEAIFSQLMEEEPGTFFLTDFLVRHFDRLVIKGLGLDRYPQLLEQFFGHYQRVVYLAQTRDDTLTCQAEACASRLGLNFDYHFTGYSNLQAGLDQHEVLQWQN